MTLVEGFDGATLNKRERPISGTTRSQESTVRCRPGTFEHRYGCGKYEPVKEARYQGGVQFALVCERAGLDGPGTVDWSKAGSAQWRGLPHPRLTALEQWKNLTQDLGKLVTARLIQYLCENKTAGQIGKMYGIGSRKAAIVLEQDLQAVAEYFGYAQRRR